MKLLFTASLLFLTSLASFGQTLYIKTFGNAKDKPLIFLHGGPGYNCANFEGTTAKKLAENGFYVIVYDRRGEGRSLDKNAQFTFQETFNDLNTIYSNYHLSKATLLGHSFGGVIATLFAEKYPEKVNSILLLGALVSLPETFKTIIKSCRSIYESKKDSMNLKYISLLEHMDESSLEYSSYCFGHAMQNGFYTAKKMTDEAKLIFMALRTDTLLGKYAAKMTYEGPQGFWKNEKYTTINLTSNINSLLQKHIVVQAIYGKDDGLYSPAQVEALKALIGANNLKYLDNCGHNAFIDQQLLFIETLKTWIK